MKVGDLVLCRCPRSGVRDAKAILLEIQGGSLLGTYWKVSDGSKSWFSLQSDMEILNESR